MLIRCFVACMVMVGLSGCSTVRIPVVVRHPAEIDLFNYKQIVLGDFKGELGEKFYQRIKYGLVESQSHFQVIDRSRINQLPVSSALITGNMNMTYSENSTSTQAKCKSKDRGEYNCTSYQRTGAVSTSGSLDVTDMQTGRILKSKLLNYYCPATTSSVDESPAYIDKNALTEKCIQDQVNIFVREVSIRSDVIYAPFKKDSDIPEIDRGIAYAKAGNMMEAAITFWSAAQASENSRSVDRKSIATAYWNAGLAYLYSSEYDKAIASFDKANSFNQNEEYLQEKAHAENLKRERQKLDQQLAGASFGAIAGYEKSRRDELTAAKEAQQDAVSSLQGAKARDIVTDNISVREKATGKVKLVQAFREISIDLPLGKKGTSAFDSAIEKLKAFALKVADEHGKSEIFIALASKDAEEKKLGATTAEFKTATGKGSVLFFRGVDNNVRVGVERITVRIVNTQQVEL